MEQVAIIGGGIVGSTTAYYLSQLLTANQAQITVYDEGRGQATAAAAGIISPWVSKRRNQYWYRLARSGAALIPQIAVDSEMTTDMYRNNGTIITRRDPDKLTALMNLAMKRKQLASAMKAVNLLSAQQVHELLPALKQPLPGVFIRGGGQMNGALFANHLLNLAQQRSVKIVRHAVKIIDQHTIVINNQYQHFDWIIVNTGAWMANTLRPLGIKADIRPQKGQLIELETNQPIDADMPVMMPEGERDFLPLANHHFIIGATHEDNMGFDLQPSQVVEADLLASAQNIIAHLTSQNITKVKVGTRAYTSDYGPFFGQVTGCSQVLVGGGLGSSGLTTGPMIGKLLADFIATGSKESWSSYTRPIEQYLTLM